MFAQEENGITMLQQEKNIRTQVEALMKEKTHRMQQLKLLLEQDQDLCDILCSMPYGIAPDSAPSPEQLENFRQYIANQSAEKVGARFVTPAPHLTPQTAEALSGKCVFVQHNIMCFIVSLSGDLKRDRFLKLILFR